MLSIVEKSDVYRLYGVLWLLMAMTLIVACSGADAPAMSPTAGEGVDVEAGRWYSEEEQQAMDPEGAGQWVAAWFAGEDVTPESIERWWMVTTVEEDTPEAHMARSVALLDEALPEGRTSAFADGIAVHGVSFDGSEVLLDLDADSEGLYGHGSAGYIIGSEQLVSVARYYFPEAETLCVAYDGVRTSIEEGGPSFLHDANGCPIRLR
ncbi:MAG: hypothetical protein ACOC9Z_06035 [Chloroflexota bacterium]